MKTNCNYCRALNDVDRCLLGYKTKQDTIGVRTVRPCEDCEKPKTWAELDKLTMENKI